MPADEVIRDVLLEGQLGSFFLTRHVLTFPASFALGSRDRR
jgi:hypothetical protein